MAEQSLFGKGSTSVFTHKITGSLRRKDVGLAQSTKYDDVQNIHD